jgi:hypothetical protein
MTQKAGQSVFHIQPNPDTALLAFGSKTKHLERAVQENSFFIIADAGMGMSSTPDRVSPQATCSRSRR